MPRGKQGKRRFAPPLPPSRGGGREKAAALPACLSRRETKEQRWASSRRASPTAPWESEGGGEPSRPDAVAAPGERPGGVATGRAATVDAMRAHRSAATQEGHDVRRLAAPLLHRAAVAAPQESGEERFRASLPLPCREEAGEKRRRAKLPRTASAAAAAALRASTCRRDVQGLQPVLSRRPAVASPQESGEKRFCVSPNY